MVDQHQNEFSQYKMEMEINWNARDVFDEMFLSTILQSAMDFLFLNYDDAAKVISRIC